MNILHQVRGPIILGCGFAVVLWLTAVSVVRYPVVEPWDIQKHPDMARNIQTLIDEAVLRGDNVVHLPEGRFEVTRPIYLTSGVSLLGAGKNTLVRVSDNSDPIFRLESGAHDLSLDGMNIYFESSSGASAVFQMDNAP